MLRDRRVRVPSLHREASLFVLFFISGREFSPNCTGSLTSDGTMFVITCTTPEGSQAIRSANYSVNGISIGTGKL